MSSLKEKFDQMEIAPDERVWERISATMSRKARRRRLATTGAVAAVAVAGLAAVLLLSNQNKAATESNAMATAKAKTQAVEQAVEKEMLTTAADASTTDMLTTGTAVTEKEETIASTAAAAERAPENVTAAKDEEPPLPTQELRQTEKTMSPTVQPATSTERNTTASMTRKNANDNATTTTAQTVSTSNTTTPKAPEQKRNTAKSGGNDSLAIWIPNAFSPDDPTNDAVRCFKVFPNNGTTILSYEIYIYSRTGRQVYHSRDINECWDGTAKGHAQPMGTYVYVIEVNDAVKGLQHKRGTITLLR